MIRTVLLVFSVGLGLLGCDGSKDGGSGDDTGSSTGDDGSGGGDDADNDGYTAESAGGDDCDDGDGSINPGADEVCDGVDNNCDGVIDSDAVDAPTWYVDADLDGYGDENSNSFTSCDGAEGLVSQGGDCDDDNADVNEGATEICDGGVDNDCDGAADTLDPDVQLTTYYRDADYDGFGNPDDTIEDCEVSTGYVENGDDCDDSDRYLNPDMVEVCDGVDNDCDPKTTEDGLITNGESVYSSIQDALDAAVAGDEIAICDGTYYENLVVTKSVTLRGANGPDVTIIDGGGASSVVAVDESTAGSAALTLEGLTLTNGAGTDYDFGDGVIEPVGGAIYALYSGSLSLSDCVVENSSAYLAGGILGSGYAYDSLTDVIIRGNTAPESVAAGYYAFYTEMSNVEIRENEGYYGAGIRIQGDGSCDAGCVIADNVAQYGAGVYLDAGVTFTMDPATEISGNAAVYSKELEQGGTGGAFYAIEANILGGNFIANSADFDGGAIFAYSDTYISDATFDGNAAEGGVGGAIFLYPENTTFGDETRIFTGISSFDDVTFVGNTATSYGGAVYSYYHTLNVSGGSFEGNASDEGGGAYFGDSSTLDISDASLLYNESVVGGAAAIYEGELYSEDCSWGVDADDNLPDDVALGYFEDSGGEDSGVLEDTGGPGGPGGPGLTDTGGATAEILWVTYDDFGEGASFSCNTDDLSCE